MGLDLIYHKFQKSRTLSVLPLRLSKPESVLAEHLNSPSSLSLNLVEYRRQSIETLSHFPDQLNLTDA